jgi:hypothetical protein
MRLRFAHPLQQAYQDIGILSFFFMQRSKISQFASTYIMTPAGRLGHRPSIHLTPQFAP